MRWPKPVASVLGVSTQYDEILILHPSAASGSKINGCELEG